MAEVGESAAAEREAARLCKLGGRGRDPIVGERARKEPKVATVAAPARRHASTASAWGAIAAAAEIALRPVPALPLDLFRVAAGLLSACYFGHLLLEVPTFSATNGLVDHSLVRNAFWYTKISLFQPGISTALLRAAFALAILASLGILVGYRARLMALIAYVIVVSNWRWNFLEFYVDDEVMLLLLFWLMILPTGRTLSWRDLLRRDGVRAAWGRTFVSGLSVRCFVANVALIYLAAGAWKWTSPLWRDGAALRVALEMPIGRFPDAWHTSLLTALLVPASYLALLLEPLIPLAFILRPSRAKRALLVGALLFHVGIIATMDIPFANLALLAALVLSCPGGVIRFAGVRLATPPADRRATRSGAIAAVSLTVLVVATVSEGTVAQWRYPSAVDAVVSRLAGLPVGSHASGFDGSGHNPLDAALWVVGLAQSYRLFDWVDYRDWDIRPSVVVLSGGKPRRAHAMFPSSPHGILLQSYIYGVTWAPVPREYQLALRTSLLVRAAHSYCTRALSGSTVELWASIRRLGRRRTLPPFRHELVMRFRCPTAKIFVRVGKRMTLVVDAQ
jgi:hypothetical protein